MNASWVVLGITRGVNYPWSAAESAPGFGVRRRSGILAGVFQGWGCTNVGCDLPPGRHRHWRLQRAGLVNAQASTWRRVCALGMLEAFCPELLPVPPYKGLRLLLQGPSGVWGFSMPQPSLGCWPCTTK